MLRDLHHVSINVADLDRSLAFYEGVLGLRRLPRPPLGSDGAWLDMGGEHQVHLIVGDVPPELGQHFAFAVDDIDEVCGALTAAGVTVRGPRPIGSGHQAFFHDPDGNRLEINQPA